MSSKEFIQIIDSDVGFNSKRKILIIVSLIFLALNLSGATLEEANTFIFKIKFTDYKGLSFLFLMSIVFLTIRYYGYAQSYQKKLFTLYSKRMLEDYRLFYFDRNEVEFSGILKKAITVDPMKFEGITDPNGTYLSFLGWPLALTSSLASSLGFIING